MRVNSSPQFSEKNVITLCSIRGFMILYTKSIKKQYQSESDGIRICVINRLTRSDGQTPVERWYKGKAFHYWAVPLAPPADIVGAYYREELPWEDFAAKYRTYLRENDNVKKEMLWIAQRALTDAVTILCVEDTHHHCHRSILAEEMQKLEPRLEVVHRDMSLES